MANDFDAYNSLYDLLDSDEESNDFYTALPAFVKDSIDQRAEDICSRDELFSYAESLLQGDE